MSETGVEETPWAVVQRLRASGASFETIIAALQERGLGREDLELLLQDDEDFRAWRRGRPASPPAEAVAAPAAPSAPTDWGRLARWSVITLSTLAAGVAAAVLGGAGGFLAMVGAWLPGLVLLALELRRGVRRTLRPLGFVFFFAFIAPTVGGFIGGFVGPRLLGTALFLSAIPLIVWASRTGARLKGLLDFGSGAVFERSGVQFSVEWTTGPFGPGEHVEVAVRAQNCLDVSRTLVVSVKGDGRSALDPQRHPVSLAPGVIEEVLVPVRVPPLASPVFGFLIDFDVEGAEVGRRVRLEQGVEWVSPSEALLGNLLGAASLASVGLGVFTLGSNGAIRVKVDDARAVPPTKRKPEVTTRYAPTPEELEAAARS
ncbi:MAG: hypothetical protein ACOZQL_07820 [Myxococcota bacterium]